MSTFLSLHIKSSDQHKVIELLKELSGTQLINNGAYPKDFDDNMLVDENADPSYLLVHEPANGWIYVDINSFKTLYDYCEKISATLNTQVIQIMGQTNSDAYYFSSYDQGVLKREINVFHGDYDLTVDKGSKFHFEKDLIPADEDDYEDIFDMDALEIYCREFGFELLYDPSASSNYSILRKKNSGATVKEYVAKYTTSKPWWKFW